MGVLPARSGAIALRRHATSRQLPPHERARAGHRLRAAGPRDLSAADGRGKPADGARDASRRGSATIPARIFEMFPVLEGHAAAGAAAICPAASSSSSRSAARSLADPKLLILDEPTEGIQPSIIKDIERVIRRSPSGGEMAILLVEQYYDFAQVAGRPLRRAVARRNDQAGAGQEHGQRKRPGLPRALTSA